MRTSGEKLGHECPRYMVRKEIHMNAEPTTDGPGQPLPHIGEAETQLSSSPPTDKFFTVSENDAPGEQIDFQWSKRRHRIRKLVREFSEQTTPNY